MGLVMSMADLETAISFFNWNVFMLFVACAIVCGLISVDLTFDPEATKNIKILTVIAWSAATIIGEVSEAFENAAPMLWIRPLRVTIILIAVTLGMIVLIAGSVALAISEKIQEKEAEKVLSKELARRREFWQNFISIALVAEPGNYKVDKTGAVWRRHR